ncbi:MAG: hypothetical protein K0Q72_30 [Armatimonadetes bacterium]|nr:hypothetical protein [Armatimonadota bacterium]
MQVAVERVNEQIVSRNYFAAWLGFQELGAEILFFEQGAVETLPPLAELVVVGSINSVRTALSRLSVPWPEIPNLPEELAPFAGRDTWSSTLGKVREEVQAGVSPYFIKPVSGQAKRFTGHAVHSFRDLIKTAGLPNDVPVFCSAAVSFRTEYRGFVHQGGLVGCKHYAGCFRHAPDFEVVDAAIAAYTSAPVAYSLDVGVTDDGRTLLIEVNDGYSLGHYGLDPVPYARLLADRWLEITGG